MTAGFYVVLCCYVAIAMTCALAAPVGKFDDALPLLHGMLIQRGYVPDVDFYWFLSSAEPLLECGRVQSFRSYGHRQPHAGQCLLSHGCAARDRVLSCPFSLLGSQFPVAALAVASSIGSAISLPPWPGFALSLSALLHASGFSAGRTARSYGLSQVRAC